MISANPKQKMHASAPDLQRCADCSIDGEACPRCYQVWWAKRHPNVSQSGDAAPRVEGTTPIPTCCCTFHRENAGQPCRLCPTHGSLPVPLAIAGWRNGVPWFAHGELQPHADEQAPRLVRGLLEEVKRIDGMYRTVERYRREDAASHIDDQILTVERMKQAESTCTALREQVIVLLQMFEPAVSSRIPPLDEVVRKAKTLQAEHARLTVELSRHVVDQNHNATAAVLENERANRLQATLDALLNGGYVQHLEHCDAGKWNRGEFPTIWLAKRPLCVCNLTTLLASFRDGGLLDVY